MRLAHLCVILSCNYSCDYCVMKEWLKPMDFRYPCTYVETGDNWTEERKEASRRKHNTVTNGVLLEWINRFLNPEEWFVKITGGEPGLYEGINGLIAQLAGRGYKGMVETNGSLPVIKTKSFPLIACWHKDRPFPVSYDKILILKNRDDDWRAKAKYCEDNGVEYKAVPLQLFHKGINISLPNTLAPTKFTGLFNMYSEGQLMSCPSKNEIYGSIFEMTPPKVMELKGSCANCPQVTGVDLWGMA